MADKRQRLVIVESPTKATKIAGYLGDGYVVESSRGHIRDLPTGAAEVPARYKGLKWARTGVNIDADFAPLYVVAADKKATLRELKQKLKAADELFLATDGDREGEAIAWHLMEELKPKVPAHRMVFHEITPAAIAEAVEQLGSVPDVVVLPVGGGGLMSGAAAWLRTHHPQVRIIGVEPDGAPCVAAAISAGRPFPLTNIDTFVDGAAVSLVGDYTFEVIREAEIELTRIPEGQVCSEMLEMYQSDGIIAEPAGALAAAALPTGGVGSRVHIPHGSRVLSIVSGGNNDVARYADVVERSLLHEGRKHYFLVNFPQEPGALRRFLDQVLGPEDDITYFEYVKRSSREVGPALVGVELSNPGDYRFLLARITDCGMEVNEVDSTSPYFRFLV